MNQGFQVEIYILLHLIFIVLKVHTVNAFFFLDAHYLITLLHLLHIGVRVPAGMCSARCTRELRSSGCGCGVGRSGPLGAGLVTLPNEGATPPFGKPAPAGKRMCHYPNGKIPGPA